MKQQKTTIQNQRNVHCDDMFWHCNVLCYRTTFWCSVTRIHDYSKF